LYTDLAVPQENRGVLIEDRVMVPRSALDHDGYRAWVKSDEYPERLRTTYVAGDVLVEMTPESIQAHNQVKGALTAALVDFVRERDLGEVYPDGALVTNEEARLSCEPDLSFISWKTFEDGRVRLIERATGEDYIELVGSPDLVVEIVSDSSVKKDTRLLLDAYARAGIREYWLIDARSSAIRFQILTLQSGRLVARGNPDEPQRSDVLGVSWQLTRVRNRAGRFTYTLASV
jgi:Uma2 family endonuclease